MYLLFRAISSFIEITLLLHLDLLGELYNWRLVGTENAKVCGSCIMEKFA